MLFNTQSVILSKNQHYCEVSSVTGNFGKGEGDSVVKSMYGVKSMVFYLFGCEDP